MRKILSYETRNILQVFNLIFELYLLYHLHFNIISAEDH